MPLKCSTPSGETLLAFSCDTFVWKALAEENRRGRHLSMACCGRPVVLKTSHLGTRFFAHARRADSSCPVESEDHLLAKDIVARAALRAGWQADTEVALKPHPIVADVLASKGRRRVAIEIQCSRQKLAETSKRCRAYEKAGIRVLWLFKQADYPRSKDMPAFRIARASDGCQLDVWVWREGHDYQRVLEPAQAVPLDEFIAGALCGLLKWRPAIGLTVPLHGHVHAARCRRGHSGYVLSRIEFGIDEVLAGHANARVPVDSFNEHPEVLRSNPVRTFLKRHGLALHFGVSNRSFRRYEQNFHRYVYSACSTCGELIGQFEIEDDAETRVIGMGHVLQLSESFVSAIPGLSEQVSRWWFGPR